MKIIDNVSVGSDPEFFLQNKKTGEFVSAEGIIKGSKYDPFFFDPEDEFAATSLDNVMAEGCIAPARTPYEFYQGIKKLQDYLRSTIPQELDVVSVASVRMDKKYLQTDNARLFGCEPSRCCWTDENSHPQNNGSDLRVSGMHIHTGYDNPSVDNNIKIAKAMDLFLGVPAVLLEPSNERKSSGYGTAGNYRHKRYGLEWRVLSGYFSSTKELVEWCYNNTIKAIDYINEDNEISLINSNTDNIINCINSEDKKLAEKLIKEFNIELV